MLSIWDFRWRNRMDFVADAVEYGIVSGVLPEVPPKDYVNELATGHISVTLYPFFLLWNKEF